MDALLLLAAAVPDPTVFEPKSWGSYVASLVPLAVTFIVLGALLAAVLAYQDWRRNRIVIESIRHLELPPSAAVLAGELAKLKARDPEFDQAGLEALAGELFERVKAARTAGEPPPRHEVSDAVFRRAVAELALEKAQGRRRFHVSPLLREARLVGAFSDPHFDALHVRMAWTSQPIEAAVTTSAANLAALASKKATTLQTEVWVFVRRPTARTLKGQSPGKCPSCGAPFAGGAANLCTHCKAILNSGSYGWVLSQRIDYEVYRGPWRQFTGYEQMVARDPGFNPETTEDRAALLFWRWLQARAERRPEIAQRLVTPEQRLALEDEAKRLVASRQRRWTSDVSVAGVDLLLMDLDTDEGHDEVAVRVRWTGHVSQFGEENAPCVPRASFATVLTLARERGAATPLDTGVSSDRCHGCKAAFQEDVAACSYCGAPAEPGKHDFVLRDARPMEDWMAWRQSRATLAQAVAPYLPAFKFVDERRRLLLMIAALMRADGVVSQAERALVRVCCARWSIPYPEILPVLEGQEQPPEITLEPKSWQARAFLEGLCDAAAIDGVIDVKERALIASVAKKLGLDVPTIAALNARAEAVRRTLKEAGVYE